MVLVNWKEASSISGVLWFAVYCTVSGKGRAQRDSMSAAGEEDDAAAHGNRATTTSPRSRSPVMGVAGLMRDQNKQQQQQQQSTGAPEGGRRGSSPAGPGTGILRLDPAKPRRSSAASVEFRTDKDDPSSPCPSDRLSVTWADGDRSVSSDVASMMPKTSVSPDRHSVNTLVPVCGSLLEEPPEDEFSVSVSAILQRSNSKFSRRSTKKRKKMRSTSIATNSSGETVVDLEGSAAEDVEATLKIHKEVLAGVSQQCWPIERKLRLVQTSREYIKKHEGEMEERLAQSSSTKDVLLRHFIRFRRFVRTSIQTVYQWITGLELWQKRIKTIESHFGSAVASYFTFLRWVLGLNVVLVAVLAAFVIIPEFLAADRSKAGGRKTLLPTDVLTAYDFKVMWDFEGIMRYSPIFYGYYSKTPKTREGYRLPLAYFLATLGAYAYSFVAILRKMAANSRMSKLSEDEEFTFAWRLLAGWDFTIGNLEAAQNKVAAINTGLREALLEAKESEREEESWKIRARRLLAHLIVAALIVASAYAVVLLVKRSEDVGVTSSWYRQNELTIILTLISFVYPNLFDLVGLLELRHPKNQLQWQLGRIMALNLLNLYTLIFALFNKVYVMTAELREWKDNITQRFEDQTTPAMDPNYFNTLSLADENGYSSTPDPYDISYSEFGNESFPYEANATLQDLLNSTSFASPDATAIVGSTMTSSPLDVVSAVSLTLIFVTNITGMPQSGTESSTRSACRRVVVPCGATPTQEIIESPTREDLLTNTSAYDLSNFTLDYGEVTSSLTTEEGVYLAANESAPPYNETTTLFDGYPTLSGESATSVDDYEYETLPPERNSSANGSSPLDEEMLVNKSQNQHGDVASNITEVMTSNRETVVMTSDDTRPSTEQTRAWTSAPARSADDKNLRDLVKVMPGVPGLFVTALEDENFDLNGNYGDENAGNTESDFAEGSHSGNRIKKRGAAGKKFEGNVINKHSRRRRSASSVDYRDLGSEVSFLPGLSTLSDDKPEGNESLPFNLTNAQENVTALSFSDLSNYVDNNVDNETSYNETNGGTSTTVSGFISMTTDRGPFWDELINNVSKALPAEDGSTTTSGYGDNATQSLSDIPTDPPQLSNDTAETPPDAEDNVFVDNVMVDEETGECYVINCTAYSDGTTTRDFSSSSAIQSATSETTPSPTTSSVAMTTIPNTSPVLPDSSRMTSTTELTSEGTSTPTGWASTTPEVASTTTSGKETSPFLVQPMKNNPEKWTDSLPPKDQKRLRELCWETMFGQEIIKLTVMDMLLTVAMIVIGDYIRAVVVRFCNGCCRWDLEKQFPGYPDFKIAENILHLVNNQGMIWMGMFFSPGLPVANILKLLLLLYVRSWAVVTSNVPPEVVFKASNNNNFYLLFLLAMLFLCTLPVGYAVVWLEPSWHCGPFSDYPKIYQLATSTLIGGLPSSLYPVIDYVSSPGVVIPGGLLLVLIIYYLLSLTAALREANSDLRDQLHQERSADKKKNLEAKSGKGRAETPTTRWGRILPLTPLPRHRLDGVSEAEKPSNLKSPPVTSPDPILPRTSPSHEPQKGKDDGPWPDDITDLGHSEVFDDSLSEPRKTGKDTPVKEKGEKAPDSSAARSDQKRHHRERRTRGGGGGVGEEDGEYDHAHRSSRHNKNRHNSYGSREEDDISLPRASRIKHRQKPHRTSQERRQSDESSHRDSPTRGKHIRRSSIVDSPTLKRKKSGSLHSKIKEKMPQECVQELNQVLQQKDAKQGKLPKLLIKADSQKPAEAQNSKSSQGRHRREPSIMKMDDIKNSHGKNGQGKVATSQSSQPGHHRSSSDESGGMQTIPVIKISKEDSVERSLQQARLERQAKAIEEDLDTGSEQQSMSTTGTTPSPKQVKDDASASGGGRDSTASQVKSPPPLETDLDEPFSQSLDDPTVTSDKTQLLGKDAKEPVAVLAKEEEVEDSGSPTSNEESTLLDNN
ncbi:transmembrane channel-like protein 2 [Macrobrachium nipponense]|uniref:transmembrane channel-like protein 2 n=1 Tax=Macrobrachium nipponense TaxID=159736 RepID=UPI0030C84A25